MARGGKALQVLVRGHHRDGDRPTQRHGNHVLVHAFPHPHTCVEAALDDVDEAFIVRQLQVLARELAADLFVMLTDAEAVYAD